MYETITIPTYKVLVRVDDARRVVEINSSAFISDTTGWTEIDSGYGDKYHHAQGNYFPKPIMDERGVYRYKLVDGKPVERTASEMDADYVEPELTPSTEERIADLEEAIDMLLTGVTE